MPSISFEIGGLTLEQKREIVSGFTDVASRATGIPREGFYVFIKENEPENVGVGGELLADRPSA